MGVALPNRRRPPSRREEVTVEFERGVPTAINGKRFDKLIDIMLEANRVGSNT